MLAKAILPWFGGTPAVWTTCMLFFQVLLLGGYVYAHLISTRLSPRAQVSVHLALLLASLFFLKILPSAAWSPSGGGSPAWSILLILGANVGIPYLVLSATSPLAQAWFRGASPRLSPYRLYALSNAGSLLALLSYPFIVEPLLTLKNQAALWAALYIPFVLACGWCGIAFLRSAPAARQPVPAAPAAAGGKTGPGWRSRSLWFLLSACGSGLLLATTNQLTLNVSVVPFMWILPFSLYLLSFILCFDGGRFYSRAAWLLPLAFSCAAVCYVLFADISVPALLLIAVCSSTLFIACMVCHGELAAHKPAAEHLTGFYVLVSAGGAFGGLLVAVAAPLLFRGPWEYPLFWLLVPSIMLALALREEKAAVSIAYRAARLASICLYIVFAGLLYGYYRLETRSLLVMERNFYGTLQVFESSFGGAKILTLMHGQVKHGFQFAEGDPRRNEPVSYYGRASGLGVAIRALRGPGARRRPLRLGGVGLGAGVIAAWTLPSDRLTFYEINPLVLRLSGEYFTYLRAAAGAVDVVMGDARLSLERETAAGAAPRPEPLDLLAIDAFSSDAIPLHLLTREAFAIYFKRLKPDGVLAVHLTNRFLDLEPLVRGLALERGLKAVVIDNPKDEAAGAEAATWMLVSGDEKFLGDPLVKSSAAALPPAPGTLVFTDQYSNLYRLLRR